MPHTTHIQVLERTPEVLRSFGVIARTFPTPLRPVRCPQCRRPFGAGDRPRPASRKPGACVTCGRALAGGRGGSRG
jgi:hypothetical protein